MVHGAPLTIQRPDIRAPRYSVRKHIPQAVTLGYWFVAPYTQLVSVLSSKRLEQFDYQVGAHIYDNDGQLVWSGAHMYDNRNVFGFRPLIINGQRRLSMIIDRQDGDRGRNDTTLVMLDDHYREVYRFQHRDIDFHEFLPADDGTAAVAWQWETTVQADSIHEKERGITGKGFRILDMVTGNMTDIWDPLEHDFTLSESHDLKGRNGSKTAKWDWMHINSIDIAHDGYVISARSTATIWKVANGEVKWRLGGHKSDFTGVDFAWQHDARIRLDNETHTLLSMLDNTEYEYKPIYKGPSVAKFVMLDHREKIATLQRAIERPDGGVSYKLGNVQTLGGWQDSVLVNWALQGYMSEHDSEDRVVMEAKFVSPRMSTYRAFKAPFVGRPLDPPDLAMVPAAQGTAMYVSWNGATEVASWAFYSHGRRLGTAQKHGFETLWVAPGWIGEAHVEALAADGSVLGASMVTRLEGIPTAVNQYRSRQIDVWHALLYLGIVSACAGILVLFMGKSRGRRSSIYERLSLK